jgi:hypothetical protein
LDDFTPASVIGFFKGFTFTANKTAVYESLHEGGPVRFTRILGIDDKPITPALNHRISIIMR